MTVEEFRNLLAEKNPPAGLHPLLLALWYDAKGNWEKSHSIVQDIHTKEAAHIHAYLHRKEGDLGNAAYWYKKADLDLPDISFPEEFFDLILINL